MIDDESRRAANQRATDNMSSTWWILQSSRRLRHSRSHADTASPDNEATSTRFA